RLDRDVGKELWQNTQAERFLATSGKFVYALDRTGLFLVMDHARGTTLAHYDMRDWTLHLANEWTDRIYLASHDGQILCLRHKDYPDPLKMKSPPPRAVNPEEKKEERKEEPMEEKKEEKKDDKKDLKDKEKEKDKDKAGWLMDRSDAVLCVSSPLEFRLPFEGASRFAAGSDERRRQFEPRAVSRLS
ncbi:MAG: hypothetical protein HY040_08190, partial [Planctomycetes bacterium]|nr:hypothetical protein [Planctomycetota bacterium]